MFSFENHHWSHISRVQHDSIMPRVSVRSSTGAPAPPSVNPNVISLLKLIMVMMMMMRRFVKRVLNSPQRRCQSIKQVALEMLT